MTVAQHDQVVARFLFRQGQFVSEVAVEIVYQITGRDFRLFVGGIYARPAGDGEFSLSGDDLHRFGNDAGRRGRFLSLRRRRGEKEQQESKESISHG